VRIVDNDTAQAWVSGDKTGTQAPRCRATVQKLSIKKVPYQFTMLNGVQRYGLGNFTTATFGQSHVPIELPNIKSMTWSRSVDTDAATMTLTLWNCEILPMGEVPEDDQYFEREGWYTPNYGVDPEASERWSLDPNEWQSVLVPDRVIRTYEGYGADYSIAPEGDPHMYASGVWLIDDVEFTHDGLITIQCRDLGRLLLDQIAFPPVIPRETDYPLEWDPVHSVNNPNIPQTQLTWAWPTYGNDSNKTFVGRGLKDGKYEYVDRNGGVFGHYGSHAFDTSLTTYWLSTGCWSKPGYEWITGTFSSRTLTAVRLKVWGGPYRIYISVSDGANWLGSQKIPAYSKKINGQVINNGSDIPFVHAVTVNKDSDAVIQLPAAIANAQRVRVTFTSLTNSGLGDYKWRAGLCAMQVSSVTTTMVPDTDPATGLVRTHLEGNYADLTDIVKWVCAWGGFYWPEANTGLNFQTQSDGNGAVFTPDAPDPVLPAGRVWGDLEQTGTASITKLDKGNFDKQPLMNVISFVRDIVGYIFYIDEGGGAVWRSPNIWQPGNYVSQSDAGEDVGRVQEYVELDEETTLLAYKVKLSGRNVRERNFVADTSGTVGGLAPGFNPHPSGMRRVRLYIDQDFSTDQECQIMADLISVREMFLYRVGTATCPGNPAIQVDDQVRIWERMTGESYLHYVRSINCTLDVSTGRYTYDLETNWLGTDPFSNWVIDASKLSAETQYYLKSIGLISS
jgi:hypothetical protein